MRMKHILLSFVICILAFEWALGDAVRPVAGEQYGGGTVVRFPGPGFLFSIPKGYTGFISPGEDVFVIGREEEEGYVLIITETGMTSEKMKTLLYSSSPMRMTSFSSPRRCRRHRGIDTPCPIRPDTVRGQSRGGLLQC
jgi:hypothetical protein